MRCVKTFRLVGFAALGLGLSAAAQEPEKNAPETVVGKLNQPFSIAIHADSDQVFISESGAGRVVRIVGGKIEPVITGWPLEAYTPGPKLNVGPLGLAFADDRLMVGDGGAAAGKDLVRVFTVPKTGAAALKIDADEKAKLGPLPSVGMRPAEGNFFGIAAAKNALYVTAGPADDSAGCVSRSLLEGTKFGELQRWAMQTKTTELRHPSAVVINPKDGTVVVGSRGEATAAVDSHLTIYNARNANPLLHLPAGLVDLTGIAYSPKTGLLYATDAAWPNGSIAGLYRLDADQREGAPSIKAVKIALLPRPTGLAFASDGTLFVTTVGANAGNDEGAVLKFRPGL